MEKKEKSSIITENRKALFHYHIIERFETGIVLQGTEVKSIRNGKAAIKDSFAIVDNSEVWLMNMHISPYEPGNRFNADPARTRKLLLSRQEIRKLIGRVQEKGLTLIPLNLHWKQNRVKVELALARAKKLFDKRESIRKRALDREMRRSLGEKKRYL